MDPLAGVADVVARLGRDLTPSEAVRVTALLHDASGAVRSYVRQIISRVTDDAQRLQVRNGIVRLPQRPVVSIKSVVNDNGDPVIYTWGGGDTISTLPNVPDTFAWEPFRNGIVAVNVVYTHGDDPVRDEIVGVVCAMVTRALGRDPADAGLTSESIAGYSYNMGSAAASGAIGMLQAERDVLDTFRRQDGQIMVAAIR